MIIEPTRGLRFLDLRELVHYRELFFFLTWRNVMIRYKQSLIGVAWAVIQPLAMMLVFTIFFGRLAGIDQEMDVPYELFSFAGLLPWQLFARTLGESSNSLVGDQRLITKVYFPRIIVPVSSCFAAVIDFAIGVVLLVIMMLIKGTVPAWTIIMLPLFVVLMLITSMGFGFWLSALNTEYRDVRYIVPFIIQFWMFVTPVVYPTKMVPENLQWLMGLNPMTGVVEGVRWAIFGGEYEVGYALGISIAIALLIFFSGIFWFRWRERTFVDTLGGQ